MKITFKAKVVADVSNDPTLSIGEPTLAWVQQIVKEGRYTLEMVLPWSADAEPSFILTEITGVK